MFLSLIIGAAFGLLWGMTLQARHRQGLYGHDCGDSKMKKACGALGSNVFSGMMRYLLITAILALLVMKYSLNVWYWLLGFMGAFWILVVLMKKGFIRK
jgi:hypothetical protein